MSDDEDDDDGVLFSFLFLKEKYVLAPSYDISKGRIESSTKHQKKKKKICNKTH